MAIVVKIALYTVCCVNEKYYMLTCTVA